MKRHYLLVSILIVLMFSTLSQSALARDFYNGESNVQTIYGKIVDEDGNPVVARVELWYSDLSPITQEVGENVSEGEQWMRNLHHATFSSQEGWYRLEAPAGKWLVKVSKGPEYTVEEAIVTIKKGADGRSESDGERMDWMLSHLYDMESLGWYSGDLHVHSSHSDGKNPISQIVQSMVASGLNFAALTDHNTVAGLEQWQSTANEDFLPISGLEVTTFTYEDSVASQKSKGFGHQNAIGVSSLVGVKDAKNDSIWQRYIYSNFEDVQNAIDETHANGGLYMLNHPFWMGGWPNGTISTWGDISDYDAIEVWNGWPVPYLPEEYANRTNMDNTMAIQAWFEILNAGNKVSGWGTSDTHDVYGLRGVNEPTRYRTVSGNARTYVHSGDLNTSSVMSSLESGRAFITSGWGPILLVDILGKEPGDIIEISEDESLPLHIKVLSNRLLDDFADGIRIIQGGKVIQTVQTKKGVMTMDVNTTVEINSTNDTWLVVQAFNSEPSMAMTNPIYLDLPPHGKWGSSDWVFPEQASEWNTNLNSRPVQTVPNLSLENWTVTNKYTKECNESSNK